MNNSLNDAHNPILEKFLAPKVEPIELRKLWGSLTPLKQNIDKSLSFISFDENNPKLIVLIDDYHKLNSKINIHLYSTHNTEVEHQFFAIEFSEKMDELIFEMYQYALYKKTLSI